MNPSVRLFLLFVSLSALLVTAVYVSAFWTATPANPAAVAANKKRGYIGCIAAALAVLVGWWFGSWPIGLLFETTRTAEVDSKEASAKKATEKWYGTPDTKGEKQIENEKLEKEIGRKRGDLENELKDKRDKAEKDLAVRKKAMDEYEKRVKDDLERQRKALDAGVRAAAETPLATLVYEVLRMKGPGGPTASLDASGKNFNLTLRQQHYNPVDRAALDDAVDKKLGFKPHNYHDIVIMASDGERIDAVAVTCELRAGDPISMVTLGETEFKLKDTTEKWANSLSGPLKIWNDAAERLPARGRPAFKIKLPTLEKP